MVLTGSLEKKGRALEDVTKHLQLDFEHQTDGSLDSRSPLTSPNKCVALAFVLPK